MSTRRIIDGKAWLTIADAAKVMETNAMGVRKLIGLDALTWRLLHPDLLTMLVLESDAQEIGLRKRAAKRAARHKPPRPPRKAKVVAAVPSFPPTVPFVEIDPFAARPVHQEVLPMSSGRDEQGWLGQKPRR